MPVNILLVDDNLANLRALEAILAGLGQNLVMARSGKEALRHLLAHDFAVVLLDVQMEGLDGFETATLIRGRERSRHTPIVFLTAFDDDRLSAEKAYSLGAVDYLTKPVSPVILRAKVRVFVELYEKVRLAEENARLRESERQLRESNQAKDNFISLLAHELRNPLSPMLNGLHILRLAVADPERLEQARVMMERQLRHLARLVDDLLDISRITHGKVQLRRERLDLARVIREVVLDHRPACDRKGIDISTELPEVPVWVHGDATRLAQVAANLFQNACKFTGPKGSVRVKLVADRGAGRAILRLCDTGIGIDPALLPRLFEPFTQADRSLDRPDGGLGLGLSLVKGLVEMHGGTVEAKSGGPGYGAEFVVRLPLESEPAALAEAAAPPAPAKERLKVLLVEDNRDAADSLKTVLDLMGHEVAVAYSGTEGIKAARDFQPDIVLCDIGLPGLDGWGVARQLRSDPVTAQARLIALSGYGRDEDKQRSRQVGFDIHVTKPVTPDMLLKLLAGPH